MNAWTHICTHPQPSSHVYIISTWLFRMTTHTHYGSPLLEPALRLSPITLPQRWAIIPNGAPKLNLITSIKLVYISKTWPDTQKSTKDRNRHAIWLNSQGTNYPAYLQRSTSCKVDLRWNSRGVWIAGWCLASLRPKPGLTYRAKMHGNVSSF